MPAWWREGDPWLTRRMRDMAAIAAGERELGQAVTEAMAEFLAAARAAVLGEGRHRAPVTAAAPPAPPAAPGDDEEPLPPDTNAWPPVEVWQAAVQRHVYPVVSRLFGERFRSETAKAVVSDYPYRQGFLAQVWSRLRLWPHEAFEDIRPELAEGIAEGEDMRQLRQRVGDALNITARSRRLQATINQLGKTIDNPETPPQVRREARARRAAAYRSKDAADSRWQPYAARIARTETMMALNGGTYAGAQAYAAASGEQRYKQWWCLPPETAVQASGVTWVARRHYTGPMVRVRTSAGAQLAATPEHKVLTATGWVVAQELMAGMAVVRLPVGGSGGAVQLGQVVDDCLDHGWARGVARRVLRHDDEIEVSPPDPHTIEPVLPQIGDALADLVAATSDSRLPALVAATLSERRRRRVGAHTSTDAMAAVDRLAVDHVVAVETYDYDGPVYDLSTIPGYFAAQGILVHNSTTDTRTRPSHWAAHMQVQPLGDKFAVGDSHLDHPLDPDGPAHEVINCRCSLLTMGPDEAARERDAYQQLRVGRTDKHGRLIDERGRPLPPAGTGDDMGTTTTVTAAAADAPAATSAPPRRWRGVLAPLGVRSGDNRMLAAPPDGQLDTRDLPLPLLWQEKLLPSHEGAQVVGNITDAWVQDGQLWGEGTYDLDDPVAAEVARKVRDGYLGSVSVDLDRTTAGYHLYRGDEEVALDDSEDPETEALLKLLAASHTGPQTRIRFADGPAPEQPYVAAIHQLSQHMATRLAETDPAFEDGVVPVEVAEQWRLMSTTLVSQPAFQEAKIIIIDLSDDDDDEDEDEEAAPGQPALTAAPPAAAPQAAAPTRPTAPRPGGAAPATDPGVIMVDADMDGAPLVDGDALDAWLSDNPLPDDCVLPDPDNYAAHEAVTAAVTGSTSAPIGSRDTAWDAAGARKRLAAWASTGDNIEPAKMAQGFLWRNPDANPATVAAYSLPFCDIVNGTLTIMPRGVFAAANAIQGGRGGANIPAADQDSIKTKLGGIYKRLASKFNDDKITPPWQGGVHQGNKPIPRQRPHTVQPKRRVPALVASAAPVRPSSAWLAKPNLSGPTPLTITDDGQVFGHAALWDTCHVGYEGCVKPPRGADYGLFHTGVVRTAEGDDIACGTIVIGKKHAALRGVSVAEAMAHYDDSTHGVAVVRAYEDPYGVVVAGALCPDVDEETLAELRRCKLSGDWRSVNGRPAFISALAVNVPGFPVARQEVDESGRVLALVAAGVLVRPDEQPVPAPLAVEVVTELKAWERREHDTDDLARRMYGGAVTALAQRVHGMRE